MDNKRFLDAIEFARQNLVNLAVNRAHNSIGSNIFLEFGEGKEITLKTGKTKIKRDWSIWIRDASWRLSKNEKYIVGSDDSRELIQSNIQELIGKRFESSQFLSNFLDVQFNFQDGYQLRTFYNWSEENQWTMFLPNETSIMVDCSTAEERKKTLALAKQISIVQEHNLLNLLQLNMIVSKISYNQYNLPVLHFENRLPIELLHCVWRLEKNQDYLIGCLDDNSSEINNQLSNIIGKKLLKASSANTAMDAVFEFEGSYILKTFSCCQSSPQWKTDAN